MAALQPRVSHRLSLLQTQLPHSLNWRNKLVVKLFSSLPCGIFQPNQIPNLVYHTAEQNNCASKPAGISKRQARVAGSKNCLRPAQLPKKLSNCTLRGLQGLQRQGNLWRYTKEVSTKRNHRNRPGREVQE